MKTYLPLAFIAAMLSAPAVAETYFGVRNPPFTDVQYLD